MLYCRILFSGFDVSLMLRFSHFPPTFPVGITYHPCCELVLQPPLPCDPSPWPAPFVRRYLTVRASCGLPEQLSLDLCQELLEGSNCSPPHSTLHVSSAIDGAHSRWGCFFVYRERSVKLSSSVYIIKPVFSCFF